jgi:hypothetical protein
MSTTLTSGHGIILMLPTNVDIKCASSSVFGLISLATLSWAPICHLTGWLLEHVPLAVMQSFFQHNVALAHYGKDVRQWLNVT